MPEKGVIEFGVKREPKGTCLDEVLAEPKLIVAIDESHRETIESDRDRSSILCPDEINFRWDRSRVLGSNELLRGWWGGAPFPVLLDRGGRWDQVLKPTIRSDLFAIRRSQVQPNCGPLINNVSDSARDGVFIEDFEGAHRDA